MTKSDLPTDPAAARAGAFLTIDMDAIAANYGKLQRELGEAACGAVVKADAYGLGVAQVAPVLAAAAGSPLLFGKRLWRETRIALFQQSIDTLINHQQGK